MARGFSVLKRAGLVYIIATGNMVYSALKVSEGLSKHAFKAGVIDLFKLKPIDDAQLLGVLKGIPNIVILEEHCVSGGMGEKIAALITSGMKERPQLKLMGIPDQFCTECGTRESLRRLYHLDADAIVDAILGWIKE
jgi:1-deoxy-D-xylulose-5-phosphate synthase